jgi:hypothetical protein
MKFVFKTAALLGMALGIAGNASATTYTLLHISGATTYRAPVHQAICDSLDSGFTFAFDAGSGGTNPYKQNAAIYVGQLNQGNPATDPYVIIKTYFTGSASGVLDLAQRNNTCVYMAGTSTGASLVTTSAASYNSSTQTWGGGTNLSGSTPSYATEVTAPDCVLSDAFAASAAQSIVTATTGGSAAYNAIHGALSRLTNTTIGLVAFEWVLGRTSATQPSITNLSQNQSLALIQGGALPIMFLTGNTSDQQNYLVLLGRNEDSGSRINAFAVAQSGFGNNCQQMQLAFSSNSTTEADGVQTGGSGATVTGFVPWPANWPLNTETGVYWNTSGHSGYIGGGDLKNALTATNPATASTLDTNGFLDEDTGSCFFIGYLGTADAVVGGNAFALSYQGVPYSVGAVQNGQYALWGYEHFYYLSSGTGSISGTTLTVAQAIATKISTTDADVNNNNGSGGYSEHGTQNSGAIQQAGIFNNSSVLVTRGTEGGVITQNY